MKNTMMNKKQYSTPTMQVFTVSTNQILCSSPNDYSGPLNSPELDLEEFFTDESYDNMFQ